MKRLYFRAFQGTKEDTSNGKQMTKASPAMNELPRNLVSHYFVQIWTEGSTFDHASCNGVCSCVKNSMVCVYKHIICILYNYIHHGKSRKTVSDLNQKDLPNFKSCRSFQVPTRNHTHTFAQSQPCFEQFLRGYPFSRC